MSFTGEFLVFGVALPHVHEEVDVALDFRPRLEEHVLGQLAVVGLPDLREQVGMLLRVFEHQVEPGDGEHLGLNLVDLLLSLLL